MSKTNIKKKSKLPALVMSRTQKDHQILQDARRKGPFDERRIPSMNTVITETPKITYTFNYAAAPNEPFFVPNPLKDDELQEVQGALRDFINDTAFGRPSRPEIIDAVKSYSNDQIADAIKEGIHRWHTYGKER